MKTARADEFQGLEERRAFVLRHIVQLADWQQPHLRHEYQRYAETAPEAWVNKTFSQLMLDRFQPPTREDETADCNGPCNRRLHYTELDDNGYCEECAPETEHDRTN